MTLSYDEALTLFDEWLNHESRIDARDELIDMYGSTPQSIIRVAQRLRAEQIKRGGGLQSDGQLQSVHMHWCGSNITRGRPKKLELHVRLKTSTIRST